MNLQDAETLILLYPDLETFISHKYKEWKENEEYYDNIDELTNTWNMAYNIVYRSNLEIGMEETDGGYFDF